MAYSDTILANAGAHMVSSQPAAMNRLTSMAMARVRSRVRSRVRVRTSRVRVRVQMG